MSLTVVRVSAVLYLAVSLAVTYITFGSPLAIPEPGPADAPLVALIALHYVWGIALLVAGTGERRGLRTVRRQVFVPELLGAASLLFFVFSYIFALNAGMDYVQRFIAAGGNLRLALDTRAERLLVWARVSPLVAVNIAAYLFPRLFRYRVVVTALGEDRGARDAVVRPWALLFTLGSAFLVTVAQPSFARLDGFPALGWVAYVPLFLVLQNARPSHALLYGVTFGSFVTVLTNFWLGTFSLVSLQITVLFFLVYYLVFTPIVVWLHRRTARAGFLVFPLAFTLFEYLRSVGFLGYPWALAAHSQFRVTPIIQLAAVTGVWGVSFLVYLGNSALAEFLRAVFGRTSARAGGESAPPAALVHAAAWLAVAGLAFGVAGLTGVFVLRADERGEADSRTIRVAQIQQNNDPRKVEYDRTFETLVELTNAALASTPDLVVWSETAFVPNIRRWEWDTSSWYYHRLIHRFLDYQRSIGTWLLTGNDDYEEIERPDGGVDRFSYNAAVLFTDAGERDLTYRKIRLVPFTEYFPYRDVLPWVYDLLLEFDVNFWEPGVEQTVFRHPLLAFSTPICYEDVFPDYVRGFVQSGAEAILNISNDYWSLTEVQATQHFAAGLFRSVENRRPVLRTTASGLTGSIDAYGRILATVPQYSEQSLVTDLAVATVQPMTIYTRWGDWFPLASAGALVVLLVISFAARPAAAGSRPDAEARRDTEARLGAQTPVSRPAPPRRRDRKKLDWRAVWDE